MKLITTITLSAAMLAIAQTASASPQNSQWMTVANSTATPTDFTNAAESTINGVVSIKSFATAQPRQSYGASPFSDPLFDFFFGSPRQQQPRNRQGHGNSQGQEMPRGLGSGVILTDDGYIVTNNHVIDGADRLEVTLNDNSTYNARVIGTDPVTDVALIKIPAENLHVIPVGDSDALRVGEWVLAVGNPFGFTSTVTTGIVSAKARGMGGMGRNGQMGIESYIQTDAAVNPGNSGGALVNTRGELVGINTAIYSETGSYVGYSFAIPTAIVSKVVNDLREYGAVQRAVLGISTRELTPQFAKEKGITAVNDGCYIVEVSDRSAAMEAGLKEGDVLTGINGAPVHNFAQLQGEMSKYSPGDKITIEYVRDNKKHKAQVTFRNSQGETTITKAQDFSALGCALKEVTAEKAREMQIGGGVEVTGLTAGKFRDAGIKEGFVILDINNGRVRTPEDVEQIYDAIMKGSDADKVMFITGLYPTGRKVYYAVDLAE